MTPHSSDPLPPSSPDGSPAHPSEPRSAVRVRGLRCILEGTRRFGPGVEVLRGLDLDVPAGQVTALVGTNGAGKTTAIRTILGAVVPSSGLVEIDGVRMGSADQAVPPDVAAVPDAPAWPEDWDARDIARLLRATVPGADLHDLGRRLRRHRIPTHQRVSRLSGGQAMQLDLAAALCRDPRLLILDEPLARLDPLARHGMLDELRELMAREGRSILLSTHNLDEMDRFVDHLVVMDGGRAVLEGEVEELREGHLLAHVPRRVLDDPRAGAALVGPERSGDGIVALVRVDDAPLLGPEADFFAPLLTDLVTYTLRAARATDQERAA